MKDIDTIIFDFNGTILDDVDLCLNILNKMLTERGYSPVSKEKYLEIFTFPVQDYYVKAGFEFDKYPFSELAVEFIDLYQKVSLNCDPYPSLIPFLNKHQDKRLLILSASHIDKLNEQVDHFKIRKYFDDILGTSTIEAPGKLDVALKYIESHHVDPNRTVFIGDTLHDYEVAKALNVHCILVAKGHQSKSRLMQSGAIVVNDINEINF